MADWSVELLTERAQIDDVMAIEEMSFTNPWTRDMYLAEFESGVSFCYLARDEARRVVGFCSIWRVVDELHINNLAVAPTCRRAGVASALLTRALGDGVAAGATRATLEVRRSNEPARQLYERFGFGVAGVRRGYYNQPIEDAIVLWREHLGDFRS
ncbi:MAG: ribosomal-protein-alanine N-acetyltransferase [Acidobacteria bacterium]|nr:ribosomal-protein-alanine N-acetyltransferase [Acidobacteriota bacterium]